MAAIRLALICALLSFVYCYPAEAGQSSARHWKGTAVFGIDPVGRWAIALDSKPEDGIFDHYWLFTASQYQPGTWFETRDVRLLERPRQLVLRSVDGEYFVALNMSDQQPAEAPAIAANKYVVADGIELVSTEGTGATAAAFDPMDVSDWPEGFASDLLNPGTGGPGATSCQAGGPGATGCSVSGCDKAPTACSVACGPGSFACCSCVTGAKLFSPSRAVCRCIQGEIQ